MRTKVAAVAIGSLLAASGWAQVASLKASFNLLFCSQQVGNEVTNFHTYDPLGDFSLFVITARTYQGFQIYVSQPIERVSHDPDRDSLQNYYIESEGNWRVGKQFMHFGTGHILRDNAVAVRSDQTIASLGLPISVIGCDSGSGLPRGILVNIGGNYGVSVAVGDDFGVSTTSLLAVRLPEQSPGLGNGFRRVYDAWYKVDSAQTKYWVEAAALRQGEGTGISSDFVASAGVTYLPFPNKSITFSVAHDSTQGADFYGLEGNFGLNKSVSLIPFIRFRNGNLFDACLSINIRI